MKLRHWGCLLLGVLLGWCVGRAILGRSVLPGYPWNKGSAAVDAKLNELADAAAESMSDALPEETTFQRVAFPLVVAKVGYGVMSFDVAVQDGYVVGVANVMLLAESDGTDGGVRGQRMNYVLRSKAGENVILQQCWGVVR